ncbi:MAG TPA: hypothetical protein VJ989_03645 [Solirubrobacterales bacterium]|nr:hypothetical protein [Solirubrobacterales bacterium]
MERSEIFAAVWDAFEVGEILTACAWCGRVEIGGVWLPLPSAAVIAVEGHGISHTICSRCAEAYMPAIAAESAARAVEEAGPKPLYGWLLS